MVDHMETATKMPEITWHDLEKVEFPTFISEGLITGFVLDDAASDRCPTQHASMTERRLLWRSRLR